MNTKNYNFLWGASTSAYQFEGAYNKDGKGLSIQDAKIQDKKMAKIDIASDHYNRYKEDIKLLKELGIRAYRFSIAWTRIYPNGTGKINNKGLEFYSNLINELIENGIEPVITMYHFDLPLELEKVGGWLNPKTIDAFVKYANTLLKVFSNKVKYWITINEQNMITLHSESIDGSKNDLNKYQKNHNMFLAHAKVCNLIHKKYKNVKITAAPNIAIVYPKTSNPKDNLAAQYANAIRNWLYLDMYIYGRYNPLALKYIKDKGYKLEIKEKDLQILKKSKIDYLAINYYYTTTVSGFSNTDENTKLLDHPMVEKNYFYAVTNENLKFTEFKWQIDELGFEITLNEIYQKYNIPILITENGLGAKDVLEKDKSIHDTYRIKFLEDHINSLKNSIKNGVQIIGYMPWSAFDLISTHQGFEKRYGFIYVNRDDKNISDLARYKKDSFYWYKNMIENSEL